MRFVVRTMAALLAVVGLTATPAVAQQAGQVVYIDSERLRQEAPSLQAARQELQQEMTQFRARADSALAPLQAELQQLATQFQQQEGTMTAGQRRQQQQELAAQQDSIIAQQENLRAQAAERQREILQPALEEINQVIQQVRADNGYAYVLDARASGVLAADPALDITDQVLSRLNALANQGS